MEYQPLSFYTVDMKYIRNLHHKDDRILSVSPQTNKDERPFLGVIVICDSHQYCVPLSKPKAKHSNIRDKIDFKKIIHKGEFLGVLNFNLMIPVENCLIKKIDVTIRKHDNSRTRKRKEYLQKELDWCVENEAVIRNTAKTLYNMYVSRESFSARSHCIDFKAMEVVCKKYVDSKLHTNQKVL